MCFVTLWAVGRVFVGLWTPTVPGDVRNLFSNIPSTLRQCAQCLANWVVLRHADYMLVGTHLSGIMFHTYKVAWLLRTRIDVGVSMSFCYDRFTESMFL